MKQLAHCGGGVLRCQWLAAVMSGAVTLILNVFRFGGDGRPRQGLKAGFCDQGGQRALIGMAQGGIAAVEPFQRRLQRQS